MTYGKQREELANKSCVVAGAQILLQSVSDRVDGVNGTRHRHLMELHHVLRQRARLVGEDVLDLTELVV